MMAAVRKCMALLVVTAPLLGATTMPEGLKHTSIPNFQIVSPGIFRGGRPKPEDVVTLAQQGIKTIVNLQGRDSMPGIRRGVEIYQRGERRNAILAERILTESLGMTFLNIPFNSLAPVSSADAEQILRALAAITKKANQPVFIHCEHGRDRTGLVVAIMRVLNEGWSPREAHAEWVRLGHAGWLTLKFTGNLDAHFNRVMRENGRPEVNEILMKVTPKVVASPSPPPGV